MSDRKGLIFDIQGFSVHDGPGCRTQVFLSGCPLRCQWCANPEGLETKQQLLFSRQKCRFVKSNCRRCVNACKKGAITVTGNEDAPLSYDHQVCRTCKTYECAKVCCYEAARLSGQYKDVAQVMHILKRDQQYWGAEGGASFSGGEPLVQHQFLMALLEECKKENIHTAIETTAYAPQEVFLKAMDLIDFAFIDVKHMDAKQHKDKTGVDNGPILRNITSLIRYGWKGRLILRMPVIKGYNDTLENAQATIDFMKSLPLYEINLLPFHRMGTSKWEQLGLDYPYKDMSPTEEGTMKALQDYYIDRDIACYIGDDVLY